MKRNVHWWWMVPLALTLCLAGCAKKKTVAEAAPPPAPAAPPAATPPPAPPAETPPPPPPSVQDQLQDAYFGTDQSTLDQAAQGVLDGDGKVLQGSSSTNVTIEGHCDERGTVEYNQRWATSARRPRRNTSCTTASPRAA